MDIFKDIYKISKLTYNLEIFENIHRYPGKDIIGAIFSRISIWWYLSLAKIYLKYIFTLDISKKMSGRKKLIYNLEIL